MATWKELPPVKVTNEEVATEPVCPTIKAVPSSVTETGP